MENTKKNYMIDLLTKFNCGGMKVVKSAYSLISYEKQFKNDEEEEGEDLEKQEKGFGDLFENGTQKCTSLYEGNSRFEALRNFLDVSRSNIHHLIEANKVLSEELTTITDDREYVPRCTESASRLEKAKRVLKLADLIKRHSVVIKQEASNRKPDPIKQKLLEIAEVIEKHDKAKDAIIDVEVRPQPPHKLIIITDLFGKGIESLFPASFKSKFDLQIIIKNTANLETVLDDLKHISENLSLSDYILLLGGFNRNSKNINTNLYTVAALANSFTNIILSAVPARYSIHTPDLNLYIKKTNITLVKQLGFLAETYPHVSFFNVNRSLSRSSYAINGANLNDTGKTLLVQAIMNFLNDEVGYAKNDKTIGGKVKKVRVVPERPGSRNITGRRKKGFCIDKHKCTNNSRMDNKFDRKSDINLHILE